MLRKRELRVQLCGVAAAVMLATAALTLPALSAAAPDRSGTVDTGAGKVYSWDGAMATGSNQNYVAASGAPCGKDPDTYCDTTLVNVDIPKSYWDTHGGGVEFTTSGYSPSPASDFDLYVYESNAAGKRGKLVGTSGGVPGQDEATTVVNASGYYLVQVVYFAVVQSSYKGKAEFKPGARTLAAPRDVDAPPGVPEALASNPALGFKSHSEPHIAQSPIDPNLLIAGSKMYYRDRDSLDEYEFKIGTYVSFDGGKSWSDLGQVDVCPPAEAPPGSWPNNTCYPDEDPNKGGTGEEDVDDPAQAEDPFDDRGSGDFGEEYTTSDVWVQFDDEGNAYAMVLDVPPFETGNGWGQTLHIWETPTPQDVEQKKTWGERIPINAYTNPATQRLFLDDKNTMAVNNAGPDKDGEVGPIVACWGQNVPDAIKQQEVCEASQDGGRTWPGEPVPVSPESQQLVIGVHVVADPRDPSTFYAAWNNYTGTLAGGPAEMWVSRSTTGGVTWEPARMAVSFTGVPTTYPGEQFRNLSIPLAAASPDGTLYISYAEYRPAPEPGDLDAKQADIMLVKSADGGLTFSDPVKVNQDTTNADQFQNQIAVAPNGEVNVAYFDRRLDTPIGTGPEAEHRGNFFIDVWLSRSNDGGQTFKDFRLTHDSWDPRINPPISASGQFIGDYQGLVADNCTAVAFFNDTHLANDPARDPAEDGGKPRSKFQEVFAWRAPNTPAYGGTATACPSGDTGLPLPPGDLRLAVDVIAPKLSSRASRSRRFRVRIRPRPGATAIDHYQLDVRRIGTKRYRRLASSLKVRRYRFRGRFGRNYRFRARAVRADGKTGGWDYTRTIVPFDDRRPARFRGGWKKKRIKRAFGGRVHSSRRRGASMVFRFRGKHLYLIGRVSRLGGKARVKIDRRRARVVSFYARKTRNRRIVASWRVRAGRRHKVRLVNLGRRARHSRGKLVQVDALGVRR
jgi:hypothetical protein